MTYFSKFQNMKLNYQIWNITGFTIGMSKIYIIFKGQRICDAHIENIKYVDRIQSLPMILIKGFVKTAQRVLLRVRFHIELAGIRPVWKSLKKNR